MTDDHQVIKTEEEIEVLRYVAAASSAAHKVVMRKVRPGTKEYQAEAAFKNEVGLYKMLPSSYTAMFTGRTNCSH